ncbi:MAG: hypothetical protein ABJ084_00350 [Halioglobus sp.]
MPGEALLVRMALHESRFTLSIGSGFPRGLFEPKASSAAAEQMLKVVAAEPFEPAEPLAPQ